MSIGCHGGGGQGSTTFKGKLDLRARLRFSQSTRKFIKLPRDVGKSWEKSNPNSITILLLLLFYVFCT